MKRIQFLVVMLFSIILFSCDNSNTNVENGWTSADREKFLNTCETSGAALGDKVKPYCRCTLEKLEKKFPNPADAGKLTNAESSEMAKDCL